MTAKTLVSILTLAFAAISGGCASNSAAPSHDGRWQHARQLVLVTTAGWDATDGQLRRFERDGGAWRQVGEAAPITVGRNGTAWGIGLHPPQSGNQKREGDGRAPAGVFGIGSAFGYAAEADTALPYAPMHADSWCMDVVDSPYYNRIVDARVVGEAAIEGSSEPMRLDLHNDGDQRYREGFVIEHNPEAVKGAGSCIFAHLWGRPGQPTAGCTAMAPAAMQALYGWLRPEAGPVFVLLPENEYAALRQAWRLPEITGEEQGR